MAEEITKLAVLADIHGNLAALETVIDDIERWSPDMVIVAGDIVNRGPCSAACLQMIVERQAYAGWQVIAGNHDLYVAAVMAGLPPVTGVDEAVRAHVRWTADQVGTAGVSVINHLPERIDLNGPDGSVIRVVHATMRGNRDNLLPDTPDEIVREQIAPAPDLFIAGHTHRPLIRRVDHALVVNVGAVGTPFDSDQRASYGRFTWDQGWHAEIVRLPYDIAMTERAFTTSGMLEHGGAIAPLLFYELMSAHPALLVWENRYRALVAEGTIGVRESVQEFLANIDQ